MSCRTTPEEDRLIASIARYYKMNGFGCYNYFAHNCVDFVVRVLLDAGVIGKCTMRPGVPRFLRGVQPWTAK